MKLSVVALVIGLLCIISAAQAGSFVDPVPFELTSESDGFVDAETEGIFTGIYWCFKAVLKTITGVKCTLKEVNSVLASSVEFIREVQSCGGEISTQMQNLITTVKNIINTSTQFQTINETYCLKESENHSGWNCFWKMLGQSMKLTNQIKKAITIMIKLPSTGPGASACINTAVYKLHYEYSSFPANVQACKSQKS